MKAVMSPASRAISQSDICDSLEFEHPLAAERPANTVREAAEVCAREVALVIPRIEVVRDVKDLHTHRGVVMKHANPLAYLQVERRKRWKPTRLVPPADERPVFV